MRAEEAKSGRIVELAFNIDRYLQNRTRETRLLDSSCPSEAGRKLVLRSKAGMSRRGRRGVAENACKGCDEAPEGEAEVTWVILRGGGHK